MRILLTLINAFIWLASSVNAQDVLDVLNTSTVPAFIMMGVSGTEIARPANLREFTGSIQNATNGLSSLPVNYAVEFLIGKEVDITSKVHYIGKNMSLSFGYTQDPMVVLDNSSRIGAGLKIPIIKNMVKPENKGTILKALKIENSVQEEITREKEVISYQMDTLISKENEIKLTGKSTSRENEIRTIEAILDKSEENVVQLLTFKKANRGLIKVIKEGLFVEVTGGIVMDIPGNTVRELFTSKYGGWVTFGHERWGPATFIGIARVMYEPKLMYLNANNEIDYLKSTPKDFGFRIAINAFENKLDAGGEVVWRSRGTEILKRSTKLLFHIAYKLGNDDKLSFSFGKDFDNNVNKEGNVVSLINFIKSLGRVETPKKDI